MPSSPVYRPNLAAALAAFFLVAGCAPTVDAKTTNLIWTTQYPGIERLGQEIVAAGKADGLSVAIVENDEIHFLNFGTTTRSDFRSPDQNTVYEIGSITKVFSSLLLAHAVTEGRVDLQDDIREYLPGEYPNLELNGSPVRLVHLTQTTSGLPDNIPDLAPFVEQGGMDRGPFLINDRWNTYTNAELLEELLNVTLLDEPGTNPRHSNVAASLLGVILEKVYGEPFADLIARYIEKPFGMQPGVGSDRERELATGYNDRNIAMPALDARYILAAGGLRYSSADMARFLRAQLAGDQSAIQLSQQPTAGPGHVAVGFNWWISTEADGRRTLRASGGTFGSSSYVEFRPELNYGIVVLANRAGAETTLYEFARQVFQLRQGRQGD